MRHLWVWLLPAALAAGQARFARVGDFDGTVAVQLLAPDDWQPVRRNMPVRELSRLRTEGSSRLEVELDDGNILRLGPDSLAELSDYTCLSTGQRITLISLDHGLAYFTGAAEAKDTTILAVPGAQIAIHQNARLRFEAGDQWTWIAASEGSARYSAPTAEMELNAGQMIKLDPLHPARFFLYREIPPLETDRWVDERDQILLSTTSGPHTPGLRYGLADLDSGGVWVHTADFGTVWKPKAPTGWAPFRGGRWQWYDGLGYTWIADDAWGWLPYHYGRWMQQPETGWFWVPGTNRVFKPGEVYWLKNAKATGWGPLAPGENWKLPDSPRLFLNASTTYAKYALELLEIDPAGFPAPPPKELLAGLVLARALPSPSFPATRLDAFRAPLRAGASRAIPVADSVTFDGPPAEPPESRPAPISTNQSPVATQVMVVNAPPVEVPVEVEVPVLVPVYTGIIVVNPPNYKAPASKKPAKPEAPGHRPKPPRPKVPDPERPTVR